MALALAIVSAACGALVMVGIGWALEHVIDWLIAVVSDLPDCIDWLVAVISDLPVGNFTILD